MRVRILVYEGADELDFVAPYEVFRHAARLGEPIEVALVSLEGLGPITAGHGLRVHPEAVFEPPADLVVVPGGGWSDGAPVGVRAEIRRGALPRLVANLHGEGTILAGVCTGAMVLSAAGLLDHRPATTHAAALDALRATAARVVEARVVDDGTLLTCGGVSSSLDLALWVVERFCGADAAGRIERYLEHRRVGAVRVSDGEPTAPRPYAPPRV